MACTFAGTKDEIGFIMLHVDIVSHTKDFSRVFGTLHVNQVLKHFVPIMKPCLLSMLEEEKCGRHLISNT